MGNPIKKALFNYQLHKCRKAYEERKEYLSDPYRRWIETEERSGNGRSNAAGKSATISYLSIAEFNAAIGDKNISSDAEWLCVTGTKGEVTPFLSGILEECLAEKSETGLV